jgi:sugar lactone lactonase YvrE
MANARHRLWHRAGPAALSVSALIAAAGTGCDGSSATENTGGGGSTTSTSTTTGGGGSGGDTGGSGGDTGGSGGATGGASACLDPTGSPDPVKAADAFSALDSTPDSIGTSIYFTAHNGAGNGEGDAGVYKINLGGTITNIFVGDPIAAPVGISISSDDNMLFVTDTAYDVTPDDPDSMRGAILTLGTEADSTPSVLGGTEGYRPRGIDIVPDKEGADTVYFTGADPTTDPPTPGVYSVPAAGGTVTKIASGGIFQDPSGIAVGTDKIFITDTLASDSRFASILLVEGAAVSEYLPAVRVGYPAGVALSCDEKTLFVSGIDPATETDVILIIDVATKNITSFTNATLGANTDAGGLHRARKAPVFSWSDLTADTGGAVYRITIK